jgi:hypothetical protein
MVNALSIARGTHGWRALVVIALIGAAGSASARPDLYVNGPYITHPAGGAGGAALSAVQRAYTNIMYGASNQQTPANDRIADDFTLAAAATLTSVVVYEIQTNASTTVSPFTAMNLRIWSGRPDDPGSQVLFGNTTTNRLVGAVWTNCYRARDDQMTNTQRPVYALEAAINPPLNLPAGTYWLDWQVAGTLPSGPSAVPVTILGQAGATGANARWKDGSLSYWINLEDGGSLVRQDVAFIIRGTTGGGPAPCYPNCDNSTAAPILNANDFQCFLNSFASGSSYANCDGSTTIPVLSANDFQCFLNRYAGGCT